MCSMFWSRIIVIGFDGSLRVFGDIIRCCLGSVGNDRSLSSLSGTVGGRLVDARLERWICTIHIDSTHKALY